jgi:mRNA interferase MazF
LTYQHGDVVLVPFPFTDLSTAKVRPAVVLSGALYHLQEPDLILGAVTSNIRAATGRLDYVLHAWQAAGLRLPSAFKPVLFTLHPGRIVHTIGSLTAADLREVERRMRLALQL